MVKVLRKWRWITNCGIVREIIYTRLTEWDRKLIAEIGDSDARRNERLVAFREKNVGGRDRVMTDEERVSRGVGAD